MVLLAETGYHVLLFVLILFTNASVGLRVRSEFNQRGVRGSIVLSQDGPSDNTTISVNLTGLSLHPDTLFQWHVHQYPFPLDGLPNPCRPGITGGHYDPLGANFNSSYAQLCAQSRDNCEIGDLSGKFGLINITEADPFVADYEDPSLSLHGVYSVIGRSIVVHLSNGERLVCANIEYPQNTSTAQDDILYSPFRTNFVGAIYFRGHTNRNTSSVYSDLLRVSGNSNSMGHNWHVHVRPVDVTGTNCSASVAGPHYNPLNADTSSSSYSTLCNSTMQENCEIGDLSNKGAPFNVVDGVVKQFYTDLALPLAGDVLNIVDRSIVIHAENRGGPRISCANITRYSPLEAVVTFNGAGITGEIMFSQLSPFDPTIVTVSLRGLGGMAGGYHVHVTPIPMEDPSRCDLAQGHWNPTGVIYNTSITRPLSSDEYEIGDLSGKFGGLDGLKEIMAVYSDPNIPLFGRYGIVGRSVVIHRQDNGSRLTCANIRLVRPVLRIETMINISSLRGRIVFSQPADDPYADTTIMVELEVLQRINVTAPTPSPTPSQATPTMSLILSVFSQTPVVNQTTASTSQAVSATPSLGTNSTSLFLSPSQTTQSVSMFSSSMEIGSGSGDSTVDMMPFGSTSVMTTGVSPTIAVSPTPTNMARRKRHARVRRQATPPQMVGFDWSVRAVDADSPLPADCSSLPVFTSTESDSALCSPDAPLACPIGDLTRKHGPLSLPSEPGVFTAVFTDPALPLSGPRSPFTGSSRAAILVQPMGGAGDAVSCSVAMVINEAPPTTDATPETTPMTQSTTPPSPPAGNDVVLIAAVVGGVLGGLLLVVIVIIVIVCCCMCTRRGSEYKVGKQSALELGTVRPSKPILGVAQYRALHDYSPQSTDDLELVRGDWVTLLDTPLGGGWWKGTVEGRGEGWFPRTYVEYVDVQAEKKKQEEENFLLAASAIMAASTSFNAQHPSLAQNRHQTLPAKTKRAFSFSKKKEEKVDLASVQRSQTVSRKLNIDSTPRAPRKLDRPYLADDDNHTEATVIANAGGEVVANGGSHPDTPVSQKKVELYVNAAAMEGSPVLPRASEQEDEAEQVTDRYIAKYDFSGSTDIELELRKGAVVNVLEKADGGWWKGLSDGRVGWFPETYIRPAPVETAPPVTANQLSSMEESLKTGDDLEATEYRSIFPYQSDTEGDLEFGEGQTVWVYWAQDNGWWYGAVDSAQGWFPGSFVEPWIDVPTPSETLERKESRSSFKKMWSLRKKSRDKSKDASKPLIAEEEAGNDEEEPPSGAQPGSLEGQLQAALERRRSFGKGRNLAVDEQVAKGQRKSEPQKSRVEIVADFMRRSFKKSRTREEPEDEVKVLEKDTVTEAATPKQEEATPKQEETTPKQERAAEVSQSTPTSKSPRKRRETTTRRAPPPPPAATTPTAHPPAAAATPTTLAKVPLKETPSPVPTKAEVTTPTPSTPSTLSKQEPSPKAEMVLPSPLKEESPKMKVVTPPSPTPRTPQSSTDKEGTKTTPPVSAPRQDTQQPKAHPRKHRSTATQRRRPPPPPNAATPTNTPKEPSGQVITNVNAEEAKTPTSEAPKSKPAHPPVPPRSLLRPRIQKVKRPISRMIPPPPNIPLPPPPTRKVVKTGQATPPAAKQEHVVAPTPVTRKTIPSEQVVSAATNVPAKPTEQDSANTAGTSVEKRPNKPPIAPKPAQLRRISAPAMSYQPESEPMKSPQSPSEPPKPTKPKPPPPARTSSLASRPTPVQRKPISPSELPKIEDKREEEEVDSPPLITKTELDEMNKKASRSAPPRRPPPPRPPSSASNRINKVEEQPESHGATALPAGGRVLYSAEEAQPDDREGVGHALKTKGSSLMRSLKKMVTRDSRKGSQKASKEDSSPKPSIKSADSAQSGAPLPKPRSRASEVTAQGQESPPSTKPARPPPPKTPPIQQKKNSVPARPPPPKPDVERTEPKLELARPPPPKGAVEKTEPKPEISVAKEQPPPSQVKPVPAPRQRSPSPESETPTNGAVSPSHDDRSSTSPDTNFYRATDDYKAQNDKELSFSKGDVLIIVKRGTDGFHFGMLDDGTTGLFPLSIVKPFFN